jgi:hypothetical protein
LLFAGEKLLEGGIVADRIADQVDHQLLNGNVRGDRIQRQAARNVLTASAGSLVRAWIFPKAAR